MLILFAFVACILALFYSLILRRWRKSWLAIPPFPQVDISKLPFISIIIAARNEDQHIAACLSSIFQQNYPRDKFEVILIDDHSDDKTVDVARAFEEKGLHLFQLSEVLGEQKIKAYKKAALQLGIEQAKGDYIVTTDADCLSAKDWLRSFGVAFSNGHNMVLGPVRLGTRKNFLDVFQALDVAGTMIWTGAAVQMKNPVLANGANFGFSCRLFKTLGGYRGNEHQVSGDDVFLLQKAKRHDASKFFFLKNEAAVVQTWPTKSWSSFFKQRLRWASKTSGYSDKFLIGFQIGVFLLNIFLIVLPLLAIAFQCTVLLILGLLCWGLKISSDYCYLSFASKVFGRPHWMRFFLASAFFHPFYVVLVGVLSLLPISIEWKGRG